MTRRKGEQPKIVSMHASNVGKTMPLSDLVGARIAAASRALRARKPAPLDRAIASLVSAPTRHATKAPAAPSAIEELFALHVRADMLPAPEREYQFDPVRRWRFDFCWPEQRLAVEIEGGIHSGGRHTRGAGFELDARKYLAATLAGWCVVRVTGKMVRDGSAIAAARELLARARPR